MSGDEGVGGDGGGFGRRFGRGRYEEEEEQGDGNDVMEDDRIGFFSSKVIGSDTRHHTMTYNVRPWTRLARWAL